MAIATAWINEIGRPTRCFRQGPPHIAGKIRHLEDLDGELVHRRDLVILLQRLELLLVGRRETKVDRNQAIRRYSQINCVEQFRSGDSAGCRPASGRALR